MPAMDRREFLKMTLAATAVLSGSAVLGEILTHAATNRKGGKMKILVITGSPRKNGNSSTLAEHFIRGAEEAGHEVILSMPRSGTFIPALAATNAA